MKKSYFIIPLLLYISINYLSAQENFKQGFIITLDVNIIYVEIEDQPGDGNYFTCRYRKGDKVVKEYQPHEISGYRFLKDSRYYTSGIVEDRFCDLLVDGEMSLYRFQNEYYVKLKDEETHQLIKDQHTWKQVLKDYYLNCATQDGDVNRMSYYEAALIRFTTRYNQCAGVESVKYTESYQPRAQFEYGILGGINFSTIKISTTFESYQYLATEYPSQDPTFGAFLDFSSPQNLKNLSLRQEVLFCKSNYSSLEIIDNNNCPEIS